jgi:ABC-type multidrug transport system fused ATPase/permease subunit
MLVRKVLQLLSARARKGLVLLVILLTGSASLEAIGIASLLPFMALVINPEQIHTNVWLSRLYRQLEFNNEAAFLTFAGISVLVLLVLTNLVKMTSTWLTLRYINRQGYLLSRRLLVSYLTRPYSFFLRRNSSDMVGVVLGQATGLMENVLRPMIEIVSAGTVCFAITAVLVIMNPVATAAILAVIGGSYALTYLLVHRKLDAIGNQQVEAYMQRAMSAAEALVGIKDLKVLGRESSFVDRFAFFMERASRNEALASAIGRIPRYALEIVSFGGLLLAVVYFVNRGGAASNVVPILALYAFAGYRLLPMLQTLFNAMVLIRYNVPTLDKLHSELAGGHSQAEAELALRRGLTANPVSFQQALELRDVTFQYEGAEEASLTGLNLTILPNTTVGLVGPTGCGKTTTVDLILGLLEPSSGTLNIDGVPLTEQNRAGWQKILGYVPQNIFLSDDTIARNIAFGIPDGEIDMVAVRAAAAIANLTEFIESDLPGGFNSLIGERGTRLSGGQRQRIGIARAMYRNPAILIMDEATSALDGITEEAVMRAVRNLSKSKTIILIAHRLSTVRECDVIYQLDRGTVAARGTYDDLMNDSSWFRDSALGSK